MNKAKFLTTSILFATFGILALSLIPAANAGIPPFMQERPFLNNLVAPWFIGDVEFSTSEDLYFMMGWAATEEELENDWAPKNPWQVKLFINNEEIILQRFGMVDKEFYLKASYWYHVFGPGYFAPGGEYLLRWEFWVRQPYQGDGLNYWRIYVDYNGIYGDPGEVWSYEYSLNIVE